MHYYIYAAGSVPGAVPLADGNGTTAANSVTITLAAPYAFVANQNYIISTPGILAPARTGGGTNGTPVMYQGTPGPNQYTFIF